MLAIVHRIFELYPDRLDRATFPGLNDWWNRIIGGRQVEGDRRLGTPALPARARRRDFRRGRAWRLSAEGWWGLATPKGTPRPIVDRLNAEFVRLFNDPKFVAFLDKQAVVSAPTTPEAFAAFVQQDRQHAAALFKLANTLPTECKPEPR